VPPIIIFTLPVRLIQLVQSESNKKATKKQKEEQERHLWPVKLS